MRELTQGAAGHLLGAGALAALDEQDDHQAEEERAGERDGDHELAVPLPQRGLAEAQQREQREDEAEEPQGIPPEPTFG